jgi:TolA-binding protein
MEELESTLDQYKEMYNQNLNDQQKLIELEKEKRRLTRQIEEKDQTIKKLQGRIDTTIEKNYSMQENEIYMKLELEKREVRFKQLEKEVKTRLKS